MIMEEKCIICSTFTKKYRCINCNENSCSFDCYKIHKNNNNCIIKDKSFTENIQNKKEEKSEIKDTFVYRTEDTVDLDKLEKLDCKNIKQLLENPHLREFLLEIDSSQNAWTSMKYAMLEPLFLEFAEECLKIVEPNNDVYLQNENNDNNK